VVWVLNEKNRDRNESMIAMKSIRWLAFSEGTRGKYHKHENNYLFQHKI
jgi:hypothetical protein